MALSMTLTSTLALTSDIHKSIITMYTKRRNTLREYKNIPPRLSTEEAVKATGIHRSLKTKHNDCNFYVIPFHSPQCIPSVQAKTRGQHHPRRPCCVFPLIFQPSSSCPSSPWQRHSIVLLHPSVNLFSTHAMENRRSDRKIKCKDNVYS